MIGDQSQSDFPSEGAAEPASGALSASPPPVEEYLRIDQVATRTGLTKRTLRYYEEVKLLDPPSRTEGGYRLYSAHDIQQLERIKRLRDLLGFSLAEIREIAEAEEEREQVLASWALDTDPHTRLAWIERSTALTERQLRLVEEKLVGLEEMRATLRARLERHAARRQDLQRQIEQRPGEA